MIGIVNAGAEAKDSGNQAFEMSPSSFMK